MKRNLWAALLLLASCQREVPKLHGLSRVDWQLAFDTARTTPDTTGWRVTTDAGYDVHVTQGTLTTWRLGLQPCPPPQAWSLIPAAYANHVEPPDPTSILPHLAENLAQPVTARLTRTVPLARYCQGFWLASAPPPAQAGEQARVSLQLRATWQKAEKSGEIYLETWMPDAKLQPVPGLDSTDGAATLTVTRHLGALLDGVDLANAPTPAMAWTVLHKLVAGASWQVAATRP